MNQAWTRFLPSALRARLEGRHYLQNVVSNTGWQFADHIVRMAVGLLIGIWLARYLGPEDFGLFSFALAFVALFSALASLGLDDIIVRDIVREPGRKDEILGSALALKLFGGTTCLAAATLSIFVLRDDAVSRWLVVVIAAGSVFQALNVLEFWFHSQVQAKYAVLAKSSTFLACALIKIALILAGAPLIAFAWIALIEVAAGGAGLVIAYRLRGHRFSKLRIRLDKAGALLRDSWPLMLSGVMVAVYLRIDQVMLGQLASHEEVGIYSVAVRLAEAWLFIPAAVYWSVFPAIVEARGQSEELFLERLQGFYNLMTFSAYAIAVPTTILAQWLVPFLFGEAYAGGGGMLALLIWANVFASLEIARSSFLTAMNWTRLYLVTVSLGCALNIALNFVLIPFYGGMGAVYASLIAYWFAAHGSCFLFSPLFRTGAMISRAIVYPKIW